MMKCVGHLLVTFSERLEKSNGALAMHEPFYVWAGEMLKSFRQEDVTIVRALLSLTGLSQQRSGTLILVN
jgi:hypothetical protein